MSRVLFIPKKQEGVNDQVQIGFDNGGSTPLSPKEFLRQPYRQTRLSSAAL